MEHEELTRSVDRIGRQAWPGGRVALDKIMETGPRRAPHVGWLAAAAVAVLLVAAPALAIYAGGVARLSHRGPQPATAAAGSPSPTTPGDLQASSSSSPLPNLPSPVPGGIPTPPLFGPSPATSPGPTAHPSPTVSPNPGGGECVGSELSVQAGTDQAGYAVGQSVTITLTVTNVSSQACWVPVGGCATDMFEVFDAGGNLVWAAFENSSQVCASAQEQQVNLAPHTSLSRTSAWAQQECSTPSSGCSMPTLAPRGTYQAGGFWSSSDRSVAAGRRQFTLR